MSELLYPQLSPADQQIFEGIVVAAQQMPHELLQHVADTVIAAPHSTAKALRTGVPVLPYEQERVTLAAEKILPATKGGFLLRLSSPGTISPGTQAALNTNLEYRQRRATWWQNNTDRDVFRWWGGSTLVCLSRLAAGRSIATPIVIPRPPMPRSNYNQSGYDYDGI